MNRLARCLLWLTLLSPAAFAQNPSTDDFRSLDVDASQIIGEIHSFQGLNGPPDPVMAGLPKFTEQYRQLRVNQVRTHDFIGPTEVDSKYDQNNSFLAWLIPDSPQRASVVKAGTPALSFPIGPPTRRNRRATILLPLLKSSPASGPAARKSLPVRPQFWRECEPACRFR